MSSRILVKAVKKAWYDSVDSIYEDKPELGTMRNTRQSILPEHDLSLDETTGWAGVEPVTALRVQGEEPAGEPVPQGSANIGFEEGDSRLPPKIPKSIPADDDPTWNPEVESEWERDPVSGARYYYSSDGQKNFVDLKDAKSGTWATRPTMGDVKNVYTHNHPEKLVGIRGPIDRYGKVHRRDSNQANENLAEAFIEHDENIPPEKLVTVPLGGRMYQIAAEDAGVPNLGYNRRGKGSSRWSDAVPPFNFKHGEPMDIAFQLLKAPVMSGRAGFPEDDPEIHPGTEMEIQELEQEKRDTGRESFPETLQNKYSTAGARLRVKPNRPASGSPEGTFRGVEFDEESGFTTGEPMEIAFQLLKERKYHPGHTSEIGMDGDSSLIDEAQRRENAYREAHIDGEYDPGEFGPWWQGPPQTTETLGTQDEDSQFTRNKIPVDSAAIVRRLLERELPIRVQQARIQDDEGPSFFGMPFNEETGFTKSLLKEYEEDNYEQAEYEQNPQWPHKNWMDSPEWPQLCDFVIEGLDYNGCGREIDGEEITGLPMMSGGAMCHQCLSDIDPISRAFREGRAKMTFESAPKLDDEKWQDSIETGEPMEIAFQLLKERKSPEAWARKRAYDSQYEKTPKRVKYREQLNAERRRRGIYGKGGKDVSHTQDGKLTLESAHSNRARHFKNRGTLRRTKVRKS